MVNGRQIRAARSLLDWSQEVLCQRSEVTRRTLTAIENDEREAHQATLARIIEVLEEAGIVFIRKRNGAYGVLLQPKG